MMSGQTNIWDGQAIRTVPEKEAKKLIKEDKAEPFNVSMPVYRTRAQFTGYQTREMKADESPVVAKESKPKLKNKPKSKEA
jgi:hypothetical protein